MVMCGRYFQSWAGGRVRGEAMRSPALKAFCPTCACSPVCCKMKGAAGRDDHGCGANVQRAKRSHERNQTRQNQCFPNAWDVFHVSNWEGAQWASPFKKYLRRHWSGTFRADRCFLFPSLFKLCPKPVRIRENLFVFFFALLMRTCCPVLIKLIKLQPLFSS